MNTQLITLFNTVCTFLVIIPFVFILVYKKDLWSVSRIQFWYLVVVLFVELTGYISSVYFHHTLMYIGVMFTLFEVLILAFLLTRWLKRGLLMYTIAAFGYASYWITDIVFFSVPHYSVIYGLANITLIVFYVYFLVSHLTYSYPKWQVSFVMGFLLYSVLSATIFAFMDFFIANNKTGFINYYTVIHAFANLCLYSFMTISILQCKKQLSPVS